MHADLIREITHYLGLKDSLTLYACLDKKHAQIIHQGGVPFKGLSIPSHLIIHLLSQISKFPKLHSLELTGRKIDPVIWAHQIGMEPSELIENIAKIEELTPIELELAQKARKINRFSVKGPCAPLSSAALVNYLEAFTLKSLRLEKIGDARMRALFPPVEGERLSDAAKNNLRLLECLQLKDVRIDGQGLLEILQGKTSLTSLNLEGIGLPNRLFFNALFREIVGNVDLKHLNLRLGNGQTAEVVDYTILAECRNLESFAADTGIDEEALIKIIEANPNLTQLDLSHCIKPVITDRVLQAIGQHLPQLTHLHMQISGQVTQEGLLPLVQGCQQLKSLVIYRLNNTFDLIVLLKDLPKLTELGIISSELTNHSLSSLSTLINLTSLSLKRSRGFLERSLLGLRALINLQYLNLDEVYYFKDETLQIILNHCSKLTTLGISNGPCLTEQTLEAIEEGRSNLRHLFCEETFRRTDWGMTTQLLEQIPKLKVYETQAPGL